MTKSPIINFYDTHNGTNGTLLTPDFIRSAEGTKYNGKTVSGMYPFVKCNSLTEIRGNWVCLTSTNDDNNYPTDFTNIGEFISGVQSAPNVYQASPITTINFGLWRGAINLTWMPNLSSASLVSFCKALVPWLTTNVDSGTWGNGFAGKGHTSVTSNRCTIRMSYV